MENWDIRDKFFFPFSCHHHTKPTSVCKVQMYFKLLRVRQSQSEKSENWKWKMNETHWNVKKHFLLLCWQLNVKPKTILFPIYITKGRRQCSCPVHCQPICFKVHSNSWLWLRVRTSISILLHYDYQNIKD